MSSYNVIVWQNASNSISIFTCNPCTFFTVTPTQLFNRYRKTILIITVIYQSSCKVPVVSSFCLRRTNRSILVYNQHFLFFSLMKRLVLHNRVLLLSRYTECIISLCHVKTLCLWMWDKCWKHKECKRMRKEMFSISVAYVYKQWVNERDKEKRRKGLCKTKRCWWENDITNRGGVFPPSCFLFLPSSYCQPLLFLSLSTSVAHLDAPFSLRADGFRFIIRLTVCQ